MQENTKDKEKYCFLRPTGIETFAFIFSEGALQWLHGTTTDDDGREIGNFTLFADLLARMALADGTAKGFHRPLTLSVGQAQYSEEAGTHRHLPFKGCICDDIPVPVAVDGKGWQRSFQSVHPQAKGKDSTALNGCKRADRLIWAFPLFFNPATIRHTLGFSMANVREEWRGASALSCEICRGITAFGQ